MYGLAEGGDIFRVNGPYVEDVCSVAEDEHPTVLMHPLLESWTLNHRYT